MAVRLVLGDPRTSHRSFRNCPIFDGQLSFGGGPCHAPRQSLKTKHFDGGGLAERLRTGLQIRVDRFDSGTRLQNLATYQRYTSRS